jgi:NADPH:quinone reductase-like Zn-dependent oxidoreductase
LPRPPRRQTNTVRAWRLHEPGSLEGLRLDKVEPPEPGPGEVLVRLRAIGLNSSELQLVTGFWEGVGVHSERRLPHIPGIEGAGEIAAVGEGVDVSRAGEQVAVHYHWDCGECQQCLTGWGNTCDCAPHWGRNRPGAWAEYSVVPARFALPLPDGVSPKDAAASLVAYSTAWQMLVVHGQLEPAETALIVGGSSGIGTAGIVLARLAGARCIATAGGAHKLARLRELGAEFAIDHNEQPNFAPAVLAATGGVGVDLVYDAIGGHGFTSGVASLRKRGRLIIGGYMAGSAPVLDLTAMTGSEVRIMGSSSWTPLTAQRVLDLVGRRDLMPVVHANLAFEELPRGLAMLRDREVVGKVVVHA